MATLNTLRTKGGVIVTIVIGLALVAFLLGDLTGNGMFFGSNVKVGTINGEDVPYVEYYDQVEYLNSVNKILSGNESVNQQRQDIIRDAVWEDMVATYSLYPGFENLGIMVPEEEMLDRIYGENISPVLSNAGIFNDPQTGEYDKSAVRMFVTNLNYDNTGNLRVVWNYLQDEVRKEALMSKYYSLVSKMVYVTDAEADRGVASANGYYNGEYVGLSYQTVADSTVKVSTAEVKKYYDANKNTYRQTASRDVEYVMFEVAPSVEDYAAAEEYVNSLAKEFAETDNVAQFVMLNSQQNFDDMYYSREQMPEDIAEFVFSGDKGVFGPVLENNVYSMLRVADAKMVPDTIALRQLILLPNEAHLADSLLDLINSGAGFEKVASGLAQGVSPDMGRISTAMIPPSILDVILSAPKGKAVKMENPNGIAIFDAYYRGKDVRKAQVAQVVIEVEPSAKTDQAAYSKASAFVTSVGGSFSNFDKTVTESGYVKRIARIGVSDKTVSGFIEPKSLVSWSFREKVNTISPILEIDGNYVVALLAGARENGFAPVEQVTQDIATILRKEKKAEILAAKMENAQSVKALAQELGASTGEYDNVNFEAYYIPGVGGDNSFIGAVAGGVEPGKLSKPIKGATGVYVAQNMSVDKKESISAEQEKVRIEASSVSYLDQRLAQILRDMSDINDMRVKFF